jgi:flagellar basal-body rod protein FlgF
MLQAGGQVFGRPRLRPGAERDMSAGTVTQTGRDLDIALSGDALLAVQAPNGDESYTRRGDLQVTDSGLVTTGDGHPVLGEGGPLTLPGPTACASTMTGPCGWCPRAATCEPHQGRPAAAREPDRQRDRQGPGRPVPRQGRRRAAAGPEARLTSKSLEGSNVNSTQALIDMIEASRSWDTQINLITSARELDTSAADLMRMPS